MTVKKMVRQKSAIREAIDFIEGKLDSEVTLKEISDIAGFSPFHFHRLFQSLTGETIVEYIRKRRLTNAALELVGTDKRIIDIAFDYNFESQESFTRAFKRHFGKTPGQYRKEKPKVNPFYKIKLNENILEKLTGGKEMEPKIKVLGELKLIGMSYYGDNKNQEIGQTWDVFNKKWCEFEKNYTTKKEIVFTWGSLEEDRNNALKHGSYRIGEVCPGWCGNMDMKTGEFEYICAMMVDEIKDLPEGFVSKVVPPHKYLVFTHKGKLDNLKDTYNFIYQTWFPKSGIKPAADYDMEWYDERFKYGQDDSEFDIMIPIE